MSNPFSTFINQNNESELFSYNLMHYFLEKQDYAILNMEEKILENFNHPYYNILYLYTAPLYNDDNIDSLLEKITIIKQRLKKQFFLFNQRILIIALNCSIDAGLLELPKNVEIINLSENEKFAENSVIATVYPDLANFPFSDSLDVLTIKLNNLSMAYFGRINAVFNKKSHWVTTILVIIQALVYSYQYLINLVKNLPDIPKYLVLTREALKEMRYYVLLTNNFVNPSILSMAISVFFLVTFGRRLEKIYGSMRLLGIITIAIMYSNALILAFIQNSNCAIGFMPIIYTFVGAFIYVILVYRRFLAHLLQRIIRFNLMLLIVLLLLGDLASLVSMLGSLISGFAAAFIIGIPKAQNGNSTQRALSGVLIGVLITLFIIIGLK